VLKLKVLGLEFSGLGLGLMTCGLINITGHLFVSNLRTRKDRYPSAGYLITACKSLAASLKLGNTTREHGSQK